MKSNLALLLALASASSFAVPQVGNVHTAINGRTVNVTYALADPGEPGIVTFELLYRGEAENAVWTTETSGDINKLVDPGKHSFSFTVADGCRAPQVGRTGVRLTAWATNAPPDYMVVDLLQGDVRWYVSTNALPAGGLANDLYRTDKLVMRRIPAAGATFSMGSGPYEISRVAKSEIAHEVSFTEDFYMGVFELTQGQYVNLLGVNDSTWQNEEDSPCRPADKVSMSKIRGTKTWPKDGHLLTDGCLCKILGSRCGITSFDLPTDAQWEFACKAGSDCAFPNGAHQDSNGGGIYGTIKKYGWYNANSAVNGTMQPHRVGEKLPNAWGLYDMHGNVMEWVLDNYSINANYSDGSPVVDPVGARESSDDGKRICRGGSFSTSMDKCTSFYREGRGYGSAYLGAGNGVRLACRAVVK